MRHFVAEKRYVKEAKYDDVDEESDRKRQRGRGGAFAVHGPDAGGVTAKAETRSGTWNNGTWTLDDEGTLTISGTGEMNVEWESAVGASTIKTAIINEGVTSIGSNAFWKCYYLESITIPSSVTSIGKVAFCNCSKLESITIPSSVTSIGDSAFGNCYSLKSITIPSSVTSIGVNAFKCCYNLESITIPSSVTNIRAETFFGCHNLKSITIPGSVTSIGRAAFGDCYSLESITIPSSVTSIEEYTFAFCYSLKSITIPGSITSIDRDAFWDCENLNNIYYLGSREQWNKVSEHLSLPNSATVNFPNEITVTFNIDDATTSERVWKGEAVTRPADPTKESDDQYTYTFAGWFTEPTGGSKVTDFSFNENTTLYAHWTKTLRQYRVSWNANDGTLPDGTAGATVGTFDYGTPIKAPTAKPTRQGYIFEGWFDQKENGDALGETTKVTKNVTYYAYWVRKVPQNLQVEAVDDQTFGNKKFILNVNKLGKGAISYQSNNEKVITVDAKGEVTIVGTGSTTITVTVAEDEQYIGGSEEVSITVNQAPGSITVNVPEYDVTLGDPDFSVVPENISHGTVTYASSDDKVVKVDANGKVKIVGVGTAVITLKLDEGENHKEATETIHVNVKEPYKELAKEEPSEEPSEKPAKEEPSEKPETKPAPSVTPVPENKDTEVKPAEETKENVVKPAGTATMYRLYNPHSGEHFYTSSRGERRVLIAAGWRDEGTGWQAPMSGIPVYRLYNKNGGEHLFTVSNGERKTLVRLGWKDEGIGFYSASKTEKGAVPVYRQYNPNAFANNHNYTASTAERRHLLNNAGWKDEGIAWYGLAG